MPIHEHSQTIIPEAYKQIPRAYSPSSEIQTKFWSCYCVPSRIQDNISIGHLGSQDNLLRQSHDNHPYFGQPEVPDPKNVSINSSPIKDLLQKHTEQVSQSMKVSVFSKGSLGIKKEGSVQKSVQVFKNSNVRMSSVNADNVQNSMHLLRNSCRDSLH